VGESGSRILPGRALRFSKTVSAVPTLSGMPRGPDWCRGRMTSEVAGSGGAAPSQVDQVRPKMVKIVGTEYEARDFFARHRSEERCRLPSAFLLGPLHRPISLRASCPSVPWTRSAGTGLMSSLFPASDTPNLRANSLIAVIRPCPLSRGE